MTRTSRPRRHRRLATLAALIVAVLVVAVVRDRALTRDRERFTRQYGSP